MAEQFIGQHLQALLAASANRELSCWLREGRSANAEVDYVAGAGRQRLIPDVTQTPVRRYSGGMRPLTRTRASAYSLNSRYMTSRQDSISLIWPITWPAGFIATACVSPAPA